LLHGCERLAGTPAAFSLRRPPLLRRKSLSPGPTFGIASRQCRQLKAESLLLLASGNAR
jgi:hypothetical protein